MGSVNFHFPQIEEISVSVGVVPRQGKLMKNPYNRRFTQCLHNQHSAWNAENYSIFCLPRFDLLVTPLWPFADPSLTFCLPRFDPYSIFWAEGSILLCWNVYIKLKPHTKYSFMLQNGSLLGGIVSGRVDRKCTQRITGQRFSQMQFSVLLLRTSFCDEYEDINHCHQNDWMRIKT